MVNDRESRGYLPILACTKSILTMRSRFAPAITQNKAILVPTATWVLSELCLSELCSSSDLIILVYFLCFDLRLQGLQGKPGFKKIIF